MYTTTAQNTIRDAPDMWSPTELKAKIRNKESCNRWSDTHRVLISTSWSQFGRHSDGQNPHLKNQPGEYTEQEWSSLKGKY